MAENVQSAMFEILKRIQADIGGLKMDVSGLKTDVSGLKTDVSGLKTDMSDVRSRLSRVEDLVIMQRRDSAAMLVMMRATVGVYDSRLLKVEEDVRLVKEHLGI